MARTKANRIAYRSHPCILLFATSQTQSALRPMQTAASSATDFMTLTEIASRKHSGGHRAEGILVAITHARAMIRVPMRRKSELMQ
jgi:hypothetical protein